jgi:hypothetical protein
MVMGWGRIVGGGEDGERVDESNWEGEQWIVAQEKECK